MSLEMRPVIPTSHQSIVLSQDEFGALKCAKACLLKILRIEENYNMLVESYVDLQVAIARTALATTLHRSFEWVPNMDVLQGLNRHIVAFLSIAHQYIDQTKHMVSSLCSRAEIAPIATDHLFSSEYDSRLGYRVMSAMRRVAQHAMLPTNGIRFPGTRVVNDGVNIRQQSVEVTMSTKVLRDETDFKREILQELEAIEAQGHNLSFIEFVKDYLAGLASIHEQIRKDTAKHFIHWDNLIKLAMSRAAQAFGPTDAIVIFDGDDEEATIETFFDGPAARIALLLERNDASAHTFDFRVQI